MQQNFLCPVCWKENTAGSKQCRYCGAGLGVTGSHQQNCPACNLPRVPGGRYCGHCGKALPLLCPNCGNHIKQDSRYCPRCSYFCGGGRQGLI